MKKLKQIVIMIFTIIFMVGTALPTYADNSGKIVIKNDSKVTGASMIGHTYSAYKIFDVTIQGEGDSGKYSYSIDEDFKDFFKANANNQDVSTDSKLNEFAKSYIRENTEKASKELMEYINKNISEIESEGDSQTINVDGDKKEFAEINSVPLGYYLVVDKGTSDSQSATSAIALGAMGTTNKVLEITLKASAPTIEKEIKHNEENNWKNHGDNQIGDKVEYRLKSTIPDTTGYNSYKYIVHDKMEDGLSFNNDIKIYIGEKKENDSNLLDTTYYNMNKSTSEDKCSFDINIDIMKGITDAKFKKGDTLYIYFTATLNENAEIANNHNDNETYLEYSNNPYDETSRDKTPEAIVKNYTFKLNALKTSEDEKTPLPGAEFEIRKGETPIYFKINSSNNSKYVMCADKKHNHSSENKECTKTIISDKNGKFEIIGLDDDIKYTIVETKAPDGYNAIKAIEFKIIATYNSNGDLISVTTDTESIKTPTGSFELGTTIVNTTDTLLPGTGGNGTIIFTIVGSTIMILTVIVFIKRKLD